MPIFELIDEIVFPDPALADKSGIIAVGGDLSPARLLQAYRLGIFPWFNEGDPIVWWSPDPRMVLYPNELVISHSMRKIIRDKTFKVTFDADFEAVIKSCQRQPRPGQKGTWITEDMMEAYLKMHEMGYAHSVEVWKNGELAGGLYGVSLGSLFAGESMFSKVSNASKAGLIFLTEALKKMSFRIIDCQVYTRHLSTLGAREISRRSYLKELENSLKDPTLKGNWSKILSPEQVHIE